LRVADARYKKIAEEKPLLVVDGCATRCASKLAAEKGLKAASKITVTEEAKARGIGLSDSIRLGEQELKFAQQVADGLLKEQTVEAEKSQFAFPERLEYETYRKDKFLFRLPKEGFYFNENDCWVYVSGNIARVGVTDYVQQSLSDIMFFTPPAVGTEIEQFGEVGTVESVKAVFEVVSPVSGKVTAVNEALSNAPEMINQNPYEQGWIAEVELTDFETDIELLLDFDGYFEILKRKVDEFHAR
jgi:glycine cleavage system H protein